MRANDLNRQVEEHPLVQVVILVSSFAITDPFITHFFIRHVNNNILTQSGLELINVCIALKWL